MKTVKYFYFFLLAFLINQTFAQTTVWKIDPVHSKIGFSVTHLIISEVEGRFNQFEGTVESVNEDFSDSKIKFVLKTNSIFTDNENRDKDLKSANFFDVKKFPEIRFESTSFNKIEENKFLLKGNLTIKDSTKQVTLEVKYGGQVKDPWGNTRAGFKIKGQINRFNFGLKWNKLLETGGAIVGKEVNLDCNIELIKQK